MTPEQSWLQTAVTTASAQARHEMERFLAEWGFAASLCELHPDKASQWGPLLDRANQIVRKAVEAGRTDALSDAVREAEKALAPLEAAAKTYTVHCVGHAHIDMNWTWPWSETVAVTNDTFTTVLRLMDDYPEFCFSQSQASVYAIVEEHNPTLLKRIARRVREGRWEVTASHWVECDKNMVGGESLCRHLLYTRRYMRRLFRLKPEDVNIDWSPDTFGHAATVPTYLVRGGIKYLYLHRPGVHGPKRPGTFWWQGPDGSRVLVRNDMALGYNGQIGPHLAQLLVGFVKETGCRAFMFVYGVGDHGGGPTRRDIIRALDMDAWPIFPSVKFSTARAFYETLEQQSERLPTLDCELNTEFTGCYTSQSLIKRDNRHAENRLLDAEAAAALAWTIAGERYPTDALREAWCDTLFCHFHDILPGSGVHDTRAYCHGLYQKTIATTSMAETQALRRLAALVDTSGAKGGEREGLAASSVASGVGAGVGYGSADGGPSLAEQSAGQGDRPFVIFNPNAWKRSEVVEAVVWDNAPGGTAPPLRDRAFSVRLPDGRTLPAQTVEGGGYWGHDFVKLDFPVSVDGLGYAQCTVVEQASPDGQPGAWQLGNVHHCPYAPNERSPEGLENDLVRLELDTCTGGIRSLLDKASGVQLIAPDNPAPALEYAVERPHPMSSWSIDHTGPVEHPRLVAIRRRHAGPYRAAIEVALQVGESDFTLTYELRAGDPHVYVRLEGTWLERGTPQTGVPVLRMAFPLALTDARARYEVPFGAVDRDLNRGEEVPALQWAQVTGNAEGVPAGFLLLNDCKHGHSLDGSVLRLTLIRASYEPDPLPEIGRHSVRLAIAAFAGHVSVAEATRRARDLNRPLRVVGTDAHVGSLPARAQFVSVGPANVIVSAIKKAVEGDALVVRVYETAGRKTTAKVQVNGGLLGDVIAAEEVDLMERPLEKSSATLKEGVVTMTVPAHGIASVRLKLERRPQAAPGRPKGKQG